MTKYDKMSEHLLELIVEEKERFAEYERLCTHYGVDPHPIAQAMATSRIMTLEEMKSVFQETFRETKKHS